MEENKGNKTQLKVDAAADVLKGTYANNVMISHTGGEFLLDFMTVFPPKGILGARIIVSPGHAKRIAGALTENISRYEKKFGTIKEAEEPISHTEISH